MDVSKRAKVLIQAMPYIKKYSGETIVVKYGGNAMINEELKAAVMSDLVLMQLVGVNVVLVHGGGPEINAMLKAVGKESKFINGMRVTDKETIDIVQMVLAGKVNKSLVQLLGSHGGKAMGLCGLDGRMLMAEKLVTGADLGYVGEIKDVNPEPLNNALASGYIPIVSTVAGGYDGNVYNINADIAASQIAAKIGVNIVYVITLCEEAKEVEGDFNKEVKNWKHFSFDDPFQHVYGDETELEYRISELYETMYCELYEFYRDELSEQLLPRCTCGANTYCRCE